MYILLVHVKLSGFPIIYHVLAIAFRCGICIPPQFLKTYDNIVSLTIYPLSTFCYLYYLK
jgi:hypothetical protein